MIAVMQIFRAPRRPYLSDFWFDVLGLAAIGVANVALAFICGALYQHFFN